MRYHPINVECVIPTGVPHCARADDVYKGMFIPKGALVVANTLYVCPCLEEP